MSDQPNGISVFTLSFANPAIPNSDPNTYKVDTPFSFTFPIQGQDSMTLVDPRRQNNNLEGLLYVPTLPANDPCNKTAAGFIPSNVTTEYDLPRQDLQYVALIPWISGACSVSYLNAAALLTDTAVALTYIANDVSPNKPFPAAAPPNANDPIWSMNGSLGWKDNWQAFPVYAINADNADVVIKQMALYSGNLTDAPHADYLKSMYDTHNYVRLYTSVDAGFDSTLPSLWVFLLIVLGVLLTMIGATSLCMHLVQRQRRRHIRNQVLAGQLDIEHLGIKRLKVPKELLDKVPLIVYVAPEDSETPPKNSETPPKKSNASTSRGAASPNTSGEAGDDQIAPTEQRGDRSPASSIEIAKDPTPEDVVEQENLPPISSLPHKHLDFAQPSCSICLDDFVSHQTILRSLACKHVFHPACIDPVLREYSSLCPICKASVLPAGYCPKITNTMVRRIRGLQRMREIQAARQNRRNGQPVATIHGRAASFSRQFGGRMNWRNRVNRDVELGPVAEGSAPAATPAAAPAATSTAPSAAPAAASTAVSNPLPVDESQARPAGISREEWARRRAENMLSTPTPAEEASRQQEAARPRWRRALGTVFPILA